MKFLRHAPSSLYHGSIRLYSIQCYIRRTRPLLERYLYDLQNRLPVRIAPDYDEWIEEVREFMGRGGLIFPGGGNPYIPWTVEVLLNRIIEEMYTMLGYAVRLSTLLPALFPHNQWPIIPKLLQWARIVEGYTTVDSLEEDYPLEPEFFSVMNMPVQFFGSQETALLYGKSGNQLYVYEPSRYLRLINISDPSTIRELMGDGMPFSSFEQHPPELIQHYTETDIDNYRASVLTHHLLNFYEADTARRESIEAKHTLARKALVEKYRWSRYRNKAAAEGEKWNDLKTPERWQLLLNGQTYDEMLREEIDLAARDRPETYQWLANKYGTDDASVISRSIQEEFPVDKMTRGLFGIIYGTFEGYVNDEDEAGYERYYREVGTWLADAVHAGKDFLGPRPDIDFVELWAKEHFSYWGGTRGFIFNGLGLKYFDYFTTEIASPRGDWTLSQWEYLFNEFGKNARFSSYIQDTMIVYTLTTSEFFRKEKVDGWWCIAPAEIMVFQPATKGHMHKATTTYNTDKCLYTGAETEENFLDEYA